MLIYLAKRIFGTRNDRILKSLRPMVMQVNDSEQTYEKMSNQELQAHTAIFKQRVENGEALESILPEAFAVVREGSKRVLGMRHYDVQLVGGAILHQGMITEMRTGEGKTLVATLPSYLNALTGKGVHIVTVNDYLARRDAEWMGRLYSFLGLSVGCVFHGMNETQKKAALRAKQLLNEAGILQGPVVTEVSPAGPFTEAEEYHQKYLKKNPHGYCSLQLQSDKIGKILETGLKETR